MILLEFFCEECNNRFEELLDNRETRFLPCPECGQPAEKALSAPNLGKYSIADAAGRAEILKQRSAEHTKKEILNKEGAAEKFGFKTTNAKAAWNLRPSKSKKTKAK